MSALVSERRQTYADYRALDAEDAFWYELLDGELVKKSSPSPEHQRLVRKMLTALDTHLAKTNAGEAFCAPLDVYVDDENVPQPDILFVSHEKSAIVTTGGIMGAPDMVAEIISPSSVKRDRVQKMKLYRRLGVPEFWILDPNNKTVEVYELTDAGYELADFGVETGNVGSKTIAGFVVALEALFPS